SVRKVLQFALANDAARIIIAHNHLNGDALPSDDDLRTTLALYTALGAVNIQLDDHIIVIENDHISFAQSGYLSYIRKIAEEETK
ncbi:MAG: JAB domain-containing protein, partial [Oscillospiraceae bacterium]|nr:JAB domain-containing protein [Oscillospiraceae bacterium]